MSNKVLFLGSIGAVAETSDIQRQSYNQALKENGVQWEWTPDTYRDLLQSNGGKDRLRTLSTATGMKMSDAQIDSIHARKTQLAGERIVSEKVGARAGVAELIKRAKENDYKVAWVTTTYPENTSAILKSCGDELKEDDFDHIFHRTDAKQGKPAPDIYHKAMDHFGVQASDCVAVEDSLNSVLAAKGAGIKTIAFLGDYHDEHVDNIADQRVDSLSEVQL